MTEQKATQNADFSLGRIQLYNWLLLFILATAGWVVFSPFIAGSIFTGGCIANISFMMLKRDLLSLMSGSLIAVKARFLIKYYFRLFVLAIILFLLIKQQIVNSIGLLVGLSTVFLSIAGSVVSEVRKNFFQAKEAS
ncbi:MAG: ATP synthase subunit I [Proteobacteria bacterium]|nr:ATP synthase subunit I [Pseudomonadota bacterium]MBU1708582.1 ATP synthase subunit I [Pseudomonadota bacterium]